jgi:hypothetical protein
MNCARIFVKVFSQKWLHKIVPSGLQSAELKKAMIDLEKLKTLLK